MDIPTRMIDWRSAMLRVHEQWKQGKFQKIIASALAAGEDPRVIPNFNLGMQTAGFVRDATLVWVAADMVDLAQHAARTLPAYPWSPSLLPFPHALCVTEKPIQDTQNSNRPLAALHWRYDGRVCGVVCWTRQEGKPPLHFFTGGLEDGVPWMTEAEEGIPVAFICAMWLLLQQRIAVRRVVTPSRAVRRRAEKERTVIPSEFVVIELRKPIHAEEATPREGSPTEWSRRWIVDGHWRNQYHPSDASHVPTWIAPHIKGPDDKPLVAKERLYKWVR